MSAAPIDFRAMFAKQDADAAAAEQLQAARKAWADKARAESELSRLRRFRGMTPGMKADQARHQSVLFQAEATLRRVLGGAA